MSRVLFTIRSTIAGLCVVAVLGCASEKAPSETSDQPAAAPAASDHAAAPAVDESTPAPETASEEPAPSTNTESSSEPAPVAEPKPEQPEPAEPETAESANANDSKPESAEVAGNDASMKKSADPAEVVPPTPEEEAPGKPIEDGYVNLPDDYAGRMGTLYTSLRGDIAKGEKENRLILIRVSMAIGNELAETDAEASRQFIRQTGDVVREVLSENKSAVPAQLQAAVFYNEACAYSVEGKLDEAGERLEQAIAQGFDYYDHMVSDPDLAKLFEQEKWTAKIEQWKKEAKERLIAHAKQDLASGESFPFNLSLKTPDGTAVSLGDYGGQVVIVDFWGTWCPPCRREIPSFIKLQETFGERGFQVIGVNYERSRDEDEEAREAANREKVVKYVEEAGINYPCVMGDDETQEQVPDFGGFPTTLFIDRTGTVRMKVVGLHEYDYLEAVVSTLLEESGSAAKTEPATTEGESTSPSAGEEAASPE